ncbi:fatty acid binding protein 1-B.1-like [Eleutherodactylus coqui]|uniref:fatty acid binding protein 1-B.1-like n=1 Tax=Eleutherodactylus coqui TaxID=57060 RepID=UPI0034622CB5
MPGLVGTYEKKQNEGFLCCMKLLNVPEEKMEKAKGHKCTIQIEKTDNGCCITERIGDAVATTNKITFDKKGEVELPSGEKVQATATVTPECDQIVVTVNESFKITLKQTEEGMKITVEKDGKVCVIDCARVAEKETEKAE